MVTACNFVLSHLTSNTNFRTIWQEQVSNSPPLLFIGQHSTSLVTKTPSSVLARLICLSPHFPLVTFTTHSFTSLGNPLSHLHLPTPPSGSAFLSSASQSLSFLLASESPPKKTVETHCAGALTRHRFASRVGWADFFQPLTRGRYGSVTLTILTPANRRKPLPGPGGRF